MRMERCSVTVGRDSVRHSAEAKRTLVFRRNRPWPVTGSKMMIMASAVPDAGSA